MTRKDGDGVCDTVRAVLSTGYAIVEWWTMYAYCDSRGKTAVLSEWDKRTRGCHGCPIPPGQQKICTAMESYLLPCDCGGCFKKGAAPRCPHCDHILSAELATSYIEPSKPMHRGPRKGGDGRGVGRDVLHSHRGAKSDGQLLLIT